MIDRNGDSVRTLVRDSPTPRGRVTLHWDGRDDSGSIVPEGSYKPRVHLAAERRTIVLPNPIRVDVTPPHDRVRLPRPAGLLARRGQTGGKDRRALPNRRAGRRPFSSSTECSASRKRGQQQTGRIEWFGRLDGEPLPPGVYGISLGARDAAGNLGPRTREKPVLIRYVALGRDRIETLAGARFAVLVLSDAARVEWRLGKRTGVARPGTLRFRAPLQPGRYTLTVTANGFSDRAAVFVRERNP